jgi:hypothetical protein
MASFKDSIGIEVYNEYAYDRQIYSIKFTFRVPDVEGAMVILELESEKLSEAEIEETIGRYLLHYSLNRERFIEEMIREGNITSIKELQLIKIENQLERSRMDVERLEKARSTLQADIDKMKKESK